LPTRKVIRAATWYSRRSQERRQSREPAAAEVLVLPLRIHQIDVELLEPLRMAARGAILGRASPSWATWPASSRSLMDRSPRGFAKETRREAWPGVQGWRHR
jgi:hypothetical protein